MERKLRTRARCVCTGVVVLGSLLSVPGAAWAAYKVGVSDNNPQQLFVRGDDDPDHLRTAYDRDADSFTVAGRRGTKLASATAPCFESGEAVATCPADGITRLKVDGGSGDDLLTVEDKGPARVLDRLVAGAGDDLVRVRGGGRDIVRCGRGTDTVIADRRDTAASGCETVRRP